MILGLNAYSNNAGIGAYDGEILMALEEERFDRVKKSGAFPSGCIAEGFSARPTAADVEAVAVPWSPRQLASTYVKAFAGNLPHSVQLLRPNASPNSNVLLPLSLFSVLRRDIRKSLGFKPPVRFVEHHRAHAALGFFGSPYDEALVLVADAFGDRCSISAFLGRDLELREVYTNEFFASLGMLYSCVTEHLGYRTVSDEGKVMALAALGSDGLYPELSKLIKLRADGTVGFDFSYLNYHRAGEIKPFAQKFMDAFGPIRAHDAPLEQRHLDLAYALQRRFEEALLHLLRHLKQRHGVRNLVYSGGVALNCAANGRVARELDFEGIFVPPNPDDGGTPLGAAMHIRHCENKRPRPEPLTHSRYGTAYSDAAIDRAFAAAGVVAKETVNPALAAAELIAEGKVVGWFQGRMEMGPRALGSRSILADPRAEWIKDHLNANVKHREPYRPYAPAVLAERSAEFFATEQRSPFMSFAFPVVEQMRKRVPAILHVDGTSRLQTVERQDQPLFHELIAKFDRITGVPMVLNTSLNDKEPICAKPADAVACFRATQLDALVIGNRLAVKGGDGAVT